MFCIIIVQLIRTCVCVFGMVSLMFGSSFSIKYDKSNIRKGNLYSKHETGVIAVFNPTGEIKPLYFEYQDINGELNQIKISNILDTKEEHYAGLPTIIYVFESFIHGKNVQCALRYHVTGHYWELLY